MTKWYYIPRGYTPAFLCAIIALLSSFWLVTVIAIAAFADAFWMEHKDNELASFGLEREGIEP